MIMNMRGVDGVMRSVADRPDAAGGGEEMEGQELKTGTPMAGYFGFFRSPDPNKKRQVPEDASPKNDAP